MPFFEIAVVVLLVLINGVLAMAELSVVSSRPARLRSRAEQGSAGARAALALAADPGRFLSTVQIGITLIGILAGAFSGATLGDMLGTWLKTKGIAPGLADGIAYVVVVGIITYFSLVIGELIPKRLALQSPEKLASLVAPAMQVLSKVAAPAVWMLDISTRLVLRLMGENGAGGDNNVTDEEIRAIVAEAETAGVIYPAERKMIAGVMRLADRPVRAVMTPRTDVDWIDLTDDPDAVRQTIRETRHTRMPACEGTPEEAIGVIDIRDLLEAYLDGKTPDPRQFVKPGAVLVETAGALDAMKVLRETQAPMAIVVDEYGSMVGLLTPADLLGAIAGTVALDDDGHANPHVTERSDGSYLVAGSTPVDELSDLLALHVRRDSPFHTAAGFALHELKAIPQEGTAFESNGWRFEVVDMDGRRIDKLLVSRAVAPRRRAPVG
ncbi:hemolysin family protein [Ancylobacter sp. 6x-1]|uniref:Hemolysin family protein n=1 Tax=Ancylobacter crimeensis TaxID=2579147 RepID=A0ABT0D7S4_9HYPH|nr:hemolysin family protein [Ancylobacter crimeensis]MCK0195993.1 hemolysin family protein [Ancylobacter crimeensis]